eukprot:COSAG02_NODE_6699_length_3414_cov_8.770437_3_plen_145_part_00
MARSLDGQQARPDIAACVSSGLFDECLQAMVALEAGGAKGLVTVVHSSLYSTISIVVRCRSHPGCDDKIRGVASALAFFLENPVNLVEELGSSTDSLAAQLCAPLATAASRLGLRYNLEMGSPCQADPKYLSGIFCRLWCIWQR